MGAAPEPAVVAWCALIASALAIDVLLIKRGHRTLSEVARRPVGQVARVFLDAHFDGVLGPIDPLSAAGRLIRRS